MTLRYRNILEITWLVFKNLRILIPPFQDDIASTCIVPNKMRSHKKNIIF